MNITAQEAKKIMDTEQDYIILDTRTQAEYDEGHIPGAMLIPNEEIEQLKALLSRVRENLVTDLKQNGLIQSLPHDKKEEE